MTDNTVGLTGAQALAVALKNNPHMEFLDLSDCLLKTDGAVLVVNALKASAKSMQTLRLNFNELVVRVNAYRGCAKHHINSRFFFVAFFFSLIL
jgi:Ran GTPase-activating protein (RanGAP) involved in mRNA processing and transport